MPQWQMDMSDREMHRPLTCIKQIHQKKEEAEKKKRKSQYLYYKTQDTYANLLNKGSLKITCHIDNLNQNFIVPGQSTINSLTNTCTSL